MKNSNTNTRAHAARRNEGAPWRKVALRAMVVVAAAVAAIAAGAFAANGAAAMVSAGGTKGVTTAHLAIAELPERPQAAPGAVVRKDAEPAQAEAPAAAPEAGEPETVPAAQDAPEMVPEELVAETAAEQEPAAIDWQVEEPAAEFQVEPAPAAAEPAAVIDEAPQPAGCAAPAAEQAAPAPVAAQAPAADGHRVLLDALEASGNEMTGAEKAVARDVFDAYCAYRAAKGLSVPAWNEALADMGCASAAGCAARGALVHRLGIPEPLQFDVCDCLACSSWRPDGREQVEAWDNHPGHHEMVQCETAEQAGVGVCRAADGMWYVALVYDFRGANVSYDR